MMSRDVDAPAGWVERWKMPAWRSLVRECAHDTVLNVGFWVKESVLVMAGLAFLHAWDNPEVVRVPFRILGVG